MKKSMKWRIAQKAELWWWKDYLNGKEKAGYLEWKKTYWENILEHLAAKFNISPHSSILDAACGPAGIFMALEDHEIVGIDPLLHSYQKQLSHFDPSDYPFVNFKNVTIEEFIHPQGFDFVFCMNGINHVSDMNRALENLIECTKPGGYVILTIDAHNYGLFKYLFRLIPGDILHPHQYNLTEYRNMLSLNGCKIILEKRLKPGFLFDHYLVAARKDAS